MKKLLLAAVFAGATLAASGANAATIFITGSDRGLGLEFTKQYAARGDTVIATCRHPENAKELNELAAKNKKIMVDKLDVLDQAQIKAIAAKYKDTSIDILINNAGVLGSGSFGQLSLEEFNRVLDTNLFGTLAVTEALRSNVAASKLKKIVGMTSPAGTFNIASAFKDGNMRGPMAGAPEPGKEAKNERQVDVSPGGGFYYGLSKVALNKAATAIRPQLKKDGITFVLIAPNAVDTDMLSELGFKGPKMTAPDAIGRFIKIIDGATPDTAGRPVVQDGTVLDW